MIKFRIEASSFVVSCVALIFLISSSPVLGMQGNLLPDLSQETDANLTVRIKKGVAEVGMGGFLEWASSFVPRVGPVVGVRDPEREIFGPKTIKGAGTLLVLNGAKEVFFGSKEKYTRLWATLSDIQKGTLDLGTTAFIFVGSAYLPRVLYNPYMELGGQGAAILLYSYLGLRGLKHLTAGLAHRFAHTDFSPYYQNTRLSRFVGRLFGQPQQTAAVKQQ